MFTRLLINTKQKLGLGLRKEWNQMLADELHKPINRKFTRRKVEAAGVDDIWSADLADMQNLQKYNKGYRYILNVIDLYSRYVWCTPIKNKTGKSIVVAFSNTIKNG